MSDDVQLLDRLRAGDETAFVSLVRTHHASLVRLAAHYVPNREVAEEVVQDAWLGVVRGLDRFEGRSSLRTWLFRIVVNRARTTGVREHRETPVEHLERFDDEGAWADPPVPWTDEVDDRLTAAVLSERVHACLAGLPSLQRSVVTLRDVEGLSPSDVCHVLGITEANQRVLLHRGRSRLRHLLDPDLREA